MERWFQSFRTSLNRLDPRSKAIGLACLSVLLFVSPPLPGLATATGVLLAGFFSSTVGPGDLARRLRSISWFVLVIIGLNAWTVSGRVLFTIAGWYCTVEGLETGALLASRLALLAIGSLLFLRSTPVPGMLDAIESGFRRPGPAFAGWLMALLLALMFGPVLVEQSRRLTRAALARGADVESGLPARVRFAAAAAVPLFVSAFRSSDHLAIAMQTRCFDPRTPRTPFRTMRFSTTDLMVICGLVIATMVVAVSGLSGG